MDNTVAERFFRTLGWECLVIWKDIPVNDVKDDIANYIKMFYNHEGLHSFTGYLSPNDYEKSWVSLN